MRKLVILRGAMGVGKSTFIKEHNLERFTLSSDTIRLLFHAPELTKDYSEMIPQYHNQKAWDLLYYLLEERMKKGEFTIIDAVNADKETLSHYKLLAHKYRYRLYIVDFSDISKEEAYKRNEQRENYKIVSKSVIDRAYKKLQKNKVSNSFVIVKPEEFDTIFNTKPRDFNHYKNIHIIGDIHGAFTALSTYFKEHPIKEEDAYIFVGDYFDRGIENYKTYMYLTSLMEKKNMTFLLGNHEDRLYGYAIGENIILDYDMKNTIEEFEKNNISKSDIRGFMNKLSQISYITFKGKKYLITHGGLPYFPHLPLDYYSTNSFAYGVLDYKENIDEIYQEFMEKENDKIYQIHGHRNYFNIDIDTYSYSYNLEGNIEHGGYLRILHLNEDESITYSLIKNDVYDENLIEKTNVYHLITAFKNNKYVYEKILENDISSFNFTREAFQNHIWNHTTMKARGLFIDTKENRIISRSYDKFFNVNERVEDNFEEMKFPVSFYLKYNGFLGLLSSNKGELFFATKSTNKGEYVGYFKKIFYHIFTEKQVKAIKKKLEEDNVTMLFEVVDPIHDPHIIKYEKEKIVLLDMIYNSFEFKRMEYSKLETFAKENQMEVKRKCFSVYSPEQLKEYYEQISAYEYKLDHNYVEGFVIEDVRGFMVKIKSGYYKKWKQLRTEMEDSIRKNKYYIDSKDVLRNEFLSYLKEKYENKEVDIKMLDVITEREDFLKS